MKEPILYTPWEHQYSSQATRQHLGIGVHEVWSRMWDGVPRFLVVCPGHEPSPSEPGFVSLRRAIADKIADVIFT